MSTTPGLDVYQWKRSIDVNWYVHILHAASNSIGYRMFGIDYYDAMLLSGEHQIKQVRELERLRGLPAKEIKLVGVTYLDEMKARLDASEDIPEHKFTVLLAPTWGPSGILSRYGEKVIRALLDTGYQIVVRPHPQSFSSEKELMDRLMTQFPNNDQLEWNRDVDNFDVLRRSDIMISDFSGVIFDYVLVFNRPVIYADTSFDRSPYDSYWIDEEPWTFQVLPKIGRQLVQEDFGRLKEIIDAMSDDPHYQAAIDEARNETWAHIGEAAMLTVDYLIDKRNALSISEAAEA